MITFDPETHTYYLGDRKVPGVTSILRPLKDFSGIPQAVLDRKSQIGTAVHFGCELFDQDVLDWNSIDPELLPYIEAWAQFRIDTGFSPDLIEHRVFHSGLIYAGTLDRTGTLGGEDVLLDIKTALKIGPEVGAQLAAYEQALATERLEKRRYRRLAVQLQKTGSYRVHTYDSADDWSLFVACLTVFNFKQKHGIKHDAGWQ